MKSINFRGKSEEALLNEKLGNETEPILRKIAESRGIKVNKLLTSKFSSLQHDELIQVMKYTSVVLPKNIERMMIDEFRSNRPYLNELLFNHNARAATTIARRYHYRYTMSVVNQVYEADDFLAAARYGLWQATQRFDLDRQWKGQPVKFLTFATPWMFRYVIEMFYKKENMIPHQSLDASPYGNSDHDMRALSEAVGEDDVVDFNEVANFSFDDEDIDNLGFVDHEEMNIIDEINDHDSDSVTDDDDFGTIDERRAKEYMTALKKLVKSDGEIDEDTSIEAVDQICRAIDGITDPEERTITLFISKRYIHHALAKIKSKCTPSILNAKSMLRGIPSSKAKLLSSLHTDEAGFAKLCNKYAAKYSREVAI